MSYVIAGRAIKNEYLALGTMGLTAGLAKWASSGESKPKPAPVESSSKEEEEFVKQFVAEAEKSEKK